MQTRFTQGKVIRFKNFGHLGYIAGCRINVYNYDIHMYTIAVPLTLDIANYWIPSESQIIFPVPNLWQKQFKLITLSESDILQHCEICATNQTMI